MTEEQVERVARAIALADPALSARPSEWDMMNTPARLGFMNMARAAIAAMPDTSAQDARVAQLEAENASFRAVLEGAGYGDLDTIAKQDPELSRMLGMEVARLTILKISKGRNNAPQTTTHPPASEDDGLTAAYFAGAHDAKTAEQPVTPQEAAKVLLEWSGDYMPRAAKLPAVHAYLNKTGKTQPAALNAAWFAALRAIAGEDAE